MGCSDELTDIISLAKQELNKNKNGELILPIRKKIWSSFGEYKIGEMGVEGLTLVSAC